MGELAKQRFLAFARDRGREFVVMERHNSVDGPKKTYRGGAAAFHEA